MRLTILTSFLFLLFITSMLSAQCDLMPEISGDSLLCPNSETTLMTVEEYDGYQWYKRGFIDSVSQKIEGATDRTLNIQSDDAVAFFSCEVTEDTCTDRTAEVLVDVYAFLLPVVSSTGDFEVDNMGNSVICEGDTMYFTLLPPYDTSITWFKDGSPIPGENDTVLTVTMEGNYTVEGAPSVCPDFLQRLGVTLTVIEEDCSTSIDDNFSTVFTLYPNPAKDYFTIEGINSFEGVFISDMKGQMVKSWHEPRSQNKFDITDLSSGVYILEIRKEGRSINKKLIVD